MSWYETQQMLKHLPPSDFSARQPPINCRELSSLEKMFFTNPFSPGKCGPKNSILRYKTLREFSWADLS